MQLVKQSKAFGGFLKQYAHESVTTKCTMKFCVFLPPCATETHKVPAVLYLAGLTCNDETLPTKAPNAMKIAAERGIALVTPDTSPRGVAIDGQDDYWDFGTAAGFYLDATEPKWKEHYNMYSYVTKELLELITTHFPILEDKLSIMGHSMGGHGALVLGLRNPEMFKSVSALAPSAHPTQCPRVIKAFSGYLGTDQDTWKEYDATLLMLAKGPTKHRILIDQGTEDQFLPELLPEAFEAACKTVNQQVELRMQAGYDHMYHFIATFIEEHINFHADALLND